MSDHFTDRDYWRAVILYGLNTATYKIALGQTLADFANSGKSKISILELAEAFFDLYSERLRTNKPQLSHPERLTVMERVVSLHKVGKLDRQAAIERVERDAFGDVIPRFHTVSKVELPVKFYEYGRQGLTLTDEVMRLFSDGEGVPLREELGARWDLLEAAFQMKRDDLDIANDIRQLYLSNGYERTSITYTRPVLNGYQQGICFYCGEEMHDGSIAVDHLLPRQLVSHDEIWNLVLAHEFCNQQKSDALPGSQYVEKLIQRNEYLIGSNHPIKNKLVQQLGDAPQRRRDFVQRVYADARLVIRYTWEGIRGYDPATDPFYKSFVRRLNGA